MLLTTFAGTGRWASTFPSGLRTVMRPLPGLGAMEVGDPEVAGRIEGAAIAAGAAEVVEDFRLAQQLVVRRQRRSGGSSSIATRSRRGYLLAGSTSMPLGKASPVAMRSTRPSGRTR